MDLAELDFDTSKAKCLGSTDVMYPTTESEASQARAMCSGCPIREACLEYALAHRERDGVWGGMTEKERRRILRRRRGIRLAEAAGMEVVGA